MNKLDEGRRVFDLEIEALKKVRDALDDTFVAILDLIVSCSGKIIVTGMGKSGHIAKKISATFSSLGTPSFYLHAAEAMHGDLGMISEGDIVIAISYSGESDEIKNILPSIKLIGAKLVAITGRGGSALAKYADVSQILPKFNEACHLGLAPTSSTTAVLCYGDALAVAASLVYGFSDIDFGKIHPSGALGKKLIIKVDDIMASGNDNSVLLEYSSLKDAIIELSKKGLGIVSIIDNDMRLLGILTDGDLKRLIEKDTNLYQTCIRDVMIKTPKICKSGSLAIAVLNIMKEHSLSCMPVVRDNKVIGTIRLQDILSAGIIGGTVNDR